MTTILALVFALALASWLLWSSRALLAWTLPGALLLGTWLVQGVESRTAFLVCAGGFAVAVLCFAVPAVRRPLVTRPVMRVLSGIFPRMSETERTALEAGTVWWDAELFSGKPRWSQLLGFQPKALSERERRFLDGPVEKLCAMLDDWKITREGDLTPEAWDYLKRERFMGMIIPEEYGGLGFSAAANSAVVAKVSSRSVVAAVSVMVPNSLGPAELLLHYGTKEQREHYLPRLARGEEVPSFALTEPGAGSDAGGMTSFGIVAKGSYEGREVLGMRLTWNKRYITLAPVTTLLGLAFKLFDPEHLLGETEDLGITCALIPADVPGVVVGRRHDPLGIPFMNGPTEGKDVFVPLEFIIGGPKLAGQGWRMLMDCLSAGRSISLPALSVGAAQLATRVCGAYASVREQFGMPIGRFEGIEERLARIAGTTWLLDGARTLTAGAVDAGEKPAVVSAVIKAWSTEGMRQVINDAMDVVGGAGICKGPRNVLAHAYQAVPIGITVEGANILTRSMIVFGQGAIRCHPFAFQEMEAARTKDLTAFDRAFFGHVGFIFTNVARAKLCALTGSRLVSVPVGGEAGRALKQLSRASAAFALLSDVAMGTLGGALKRKESLSGRLADALAWQYLASAAVKRYVDGGQAERDRPFFRWSLATCLHEIQEALLGVLDNLPNRPAAFLVRLALFPLGRAWKKPSDRVAHQVAKAILDGGEARERLSSAIFVPEREEQGLWTLEHALALTVKATPARKKIAEAIKAKRLPRKREAELVELALSEGVLTREERDLVRRALEAREAAITVDDFSPEEIAGAAGSGHRTAASAR